MSQLRTDLVCISRILSLTAETTRLDISKTAYVKMVLDPHFAPAYFGWYQSRFLSARFDFGISVRCFIIQNGLPINIQILIFRGYNNQLPVIP